MQLDIVRPRRMILDFPYSPWYEFPFIGEMTIQIDRELKELEETIKREMKE